MKILLLILLFLSFDISATENLFLYNAKENLKITIKKETNTPENENIIYNYQIYPFNNSNSANWYASGRDCAKIINTNYIDFYYGVYTCTNILDQSFNLNSNQIIEISFNLERQAYGSNYYTSFSLNNVFSFYYHRDYSNYFQFSDNVDDRVPLTSAVTTSDTNYKITYENGELNFYINNDLIMKVNNYNFPEIVEGRFYMQVNNSRMVLRNLKVIVKEEI